MDVFEAIKSSEWDMGIFFPDCTFLTVSANKWYKDQPPRESGALVGQARRDAREIAVDFFMKLYVCGIPKIAIENPIGIMSTRFRKPDQIIQPWQHGHPESKATCLWLKNLPKLQPTNNVYDQMMLLPKKERERIHNMKKTEDRGKLRSKTYAGIAKAMANTWG